MALNNQPQAQSKYFKEEAEEFEETVNFATMNLDTPMKGCKADGGMERVRKSNFIQKSTSLKSGMLAEPVKVKDVPKNKFSAYPHSNNINKKY